MSLIVEDGSGLSTAESYASISTADAYFTAHGLTTWTGATGVKEAALRNGTQYIELAYGLRFLGVRSTTTQALSYPRANVVVDGQTLSSTAIPTKLVEAACEAALRALAGELMPDLTDSGELTAESIQVGPIEISQQWSGGQGQIPYLRKVDMLMQPLILSGGMVVRS